MKNSKRIKDLKNQLVNIRREISENVWDDAFTSPSFTHDRFMIMLRKKKEEIESELFH